MPEVHRSAETNDNLREGRLFNSRLVRAFIFVLLATGVVGCARESRLLKKENCENFSARTHKNTDGTHGFDKIFVYPSNSPGKEFRCAIKPECRELGKDENPESKDCVDWPVPCDEQ